MTKIMMAMIAALLLAGCNASQIADACKADAVAQPLVAGLAVPVTTLADPSLAPYAAEAVAIDTAAVQPAIQAACMAAETPAATATTAAK